MTHPLCCAEEAPDGDGQTFVLPPHVGPVDWGRCASAVGPDLRCVALSVSKSRRCPKQAVLELEWSADGHWPSLVPVLCGGHFIVHRSGKELRVYG